ncbi:MAG TPA: carbohydrate ABC transporter permease [Candidatus Hydrogenedentes bacterium]|nr:carbohydrate ABC transporter permease [Candidatus Hydrogenedentota bacterium]
MKRDNLLRDILLHAVILCFAFMTLVPFAFVINSSFRTNAEVYHGYFAIPEAFKGTVHAVANIVKGDTQPLEVADPEGKAQHLPPKDALSFNVNLASLNYQRAWKIIRPYIINSLVVSGSTAAAVLFLASLTAFVLSRYRFFGSRFCYLFIISVMMFPAVLTLVPSYLLLRTFGMLNSYWAMIIPYTAGGLAFAIFILKGFFDGLPEDLFEAARIDGAGHFQSYRHIVLPLSKPILSVVLIMNLLGTWNEFMWPFIVNSEGKYHVIASALYVLSASTFITDLTALFAAYMLASLPLLILFIFATRPFIQGVTSGAFKA